MSFIHAPIPGRFVNALAGQKVQYCVNGQCPTANVTIRRFSFYSVEKKQQNSSPLLEIRLNLGDFFAGFGLLPDQVIDLLNGMDDSTVVASAEVVAD